MHIHTHTRAHTHTHTHTHTGQISGLWAALLCISGGTWSYQGSLIRYIFIKFSNWKRASQGKRNMLIGREYSSLLTSLCPSICNPHPPPPASTLYLSIPSSNGRATVATDKELRLLGERDSDGELREREGGRKKRLAKEGKCLAFSRAEKRGLRELWERWNSFFFSFYTPSLPGATLILYLSPPITHTHTNTHTHTHALTCPVLILWLWGEARRVCVSQS